MPTDTRRGRPRDRRRARRRRRRTRSERRSANTRAPRCRAPASRGRATRPSASSRRAVPRSRAPRGTPRSRARTGVIVGLPRVPRAQPQRCLEAGERQRQQVLDPAPRRGGVVHRGRPRWPSRGPANRRNRRPAGRGWRAAAAPAGAASRRPRPVIGRPARGALRSTTARRSSPTLRRPRPAATDRARDRAVVGAGLRIERRLDVLHLRAQAREHPLEHRRRVRSARGRRRVAPARGGWRGGRRRAAARVTDGASRVSPVRSPLRRSDRSPASPDEDRTVPQHAAARQRDRHRFAARQHRGEPAADALLIGQAQPWCRPAPARRSAASVAKAVRRSIGSTQSEQEVALRERQFARRLAVEQDAVGVDLVRLGIDGDLRRHRVVDHRALW